MEAQPRQITSYIKVDGRVPFEEWLNQLRDTKARARIRLSLDRVSQGNFGYCRFVGQGVFELKLDYDPGYRVYFGQVKLLIVLLCGGDKSTQEQDILRAREYWADYEEREAANQ